MFEGTPEVMQRSLAALRSLPPDTLLYPGHEYTVRNLEFALHVEPDNHDVVARLAQARERRAQGQPCVPSTLREEIATNPFLRWDAPSVVAFARAHGAEAADAPAIFAAIRRAKDTF
jgi:hydroxyacylglutathione hydrolase